MKGTILDFSIQTNIGVISGDDNKRYNFIGAEWKDHSIPVRGVKVDFDITPDSNKAISVYLALEQNNHSTSEQIALEADYNLIDWTKKCFNHYANFEGRARRQEYWLFYLAIVIISIILQVFDEVFETYSIFSGIWNLVTFIPILSVGARRLHDTGRSGWWQLLILTIVGIIPLIILLVLDTQKENNQWGEPAK